MHMKISMEVFVMTLMISIPASADSSQFGQSRRLREEGKMREKLLQD